MKRQQQIVLLATALNLALVLLFPPYDYTSMQRGNIPTFDGFYFIFGNHPNRITNNNFLTLEIIVVLINACIVWLLLRERPLGKSAPGGNRYQRGVLWLTAMNLIMVVLFPPFQNYAAITKAALPSFEGFYFLFFDNSQRQLVAPILYLEVCLILINGALLWLMLKGRGQAKLSTNEVRELAGEIRAAQSNG